MKAAGQLSAEVLRKIGELVKPGVTTHELDEFAETYIREHGGIPAFKGYGGFPGSICASVNEQIVHGIPSKKVVLQTGDILSVDTGATVDGWVGDNAWTFAVGKISDDKKRLLKVTEQCMWAGLESAVAGNHLGDIGHGVQSIAEKAGYGVVREYVGHGVGHNMHEEPNVPNYGHRHLGMKLQVGMVLAIEPMINMGSRKVVDGNDGLHFPGATESQARISRRWVANSPKTDLWFLPPSRIVVVPLCGVSHYFFSTGAQLKW